MIPYTRPSGQSASDDPLSIGASGDIPNPVAALRELHFLPSDNPLRPESRPDIYLIHVQPNLWLQGPLAPADRTGWAGRFTVNQTLCNGNPRRERSNGPWHEPCRCTGTPGPTAASMSSMVESLLILAMPQISWKEPTFSEARSSILASAVLIMPVKCSPPASLAHVSPWHGFPTIIRETCQNRSTTCRTATTSIAHP